MIKKAIRWFLIVSGSVILISILIIMVIPKIAPQFGAAPNKIDIEKFEKSPQYRNGKFANSVKTPMNSEDGSMLQAALQFFKEGTNREPNRTIETAQFDKESFIQASDGLVSCWFGHSTVLINIEGKSILIDPVFSKHVSPFSFLGPQAFPYSNTYSLDDLPKIDAVLISHDHYDHLDYETIRSLKTKVDQFYVPLGLAAHLKKWGIPSENIHEMDWWEETVFQDSLMFGCVPMRHFSGRGITDRFSTLWCGWVIKSKKHSIIHTGDSGYGDHFKEIGEKYGPFDLAMVECGQYNENWPYIHMMPEQTVDASIDLKADVLMPIHWGRFKLSLHAWTDPIDRVSNEASKKNVEVVTPIVGQQFSISPPLPNSLWWKGD